MTERERALKEWDDENRERVLTYHAEYHQLGPMYDQMQERWRELARDWRSEHPEHAAYYGAMRRSKIQQTSLDPEYSGMIRAIYQSVKRVTECLGIQFHVDHTVPLSKGGTHTPDNLQVVPASWNMTKGNRHCRSWQPAI